MEGSGSRRIVPGSYTRVSSCLEREDRKLARLIKESDWIIATQTSYPKVSQLAGDKPVVAAEFKIDQQSLASFSRKVNSLDTQTVVPSLLKIAATAN